MDFPSSKKPAGHKPSNSELLNSAKLVAEAAQSHLRHEPGNKYDKAKVAAAAADLLDAAEDYGKVDANSNMGKYLDKAEEYLHKYGNKTSTNSQQHSSSAAVHGGSKRSEGGGAGDYIKMAQGFMHKSEGGADGKSSGGAGDFMKMAGDFMKK